MQQKLPASYLFWGILWVLVMGMIFLFSSLPGSATYYEPPLLLVLERKGAHIVEYFLLTLVSFRFFGLLFTGESKRRIGMLAAAWALMYAATDELHQYFTPFRGAYMQDVVIDLFGIVLAGSAIYLYRLWKK
jgi:VanZ family protein